MKEMKILSLADSVNMFLSLIKTPTFLDVFLHTSPLCLLKFKCLSLPVTLNINIHVYLYWQKSSFNVLGVNFLKEFSSLVQYQYVKGFQKFHSGVKLNRMCGMSLLAITF